MRTTHIKIVSLINSISSLSARILSMLAFEFVDENEGEESPNALIDTVDDDDILYNEISDLINNLESIQANIRQGIKHKDAFMICTYECIDNACGSKKEIWNSIDSKIPEHIRCGCEKIMVHNPKSNIFSKRHHLKQNEQYFGYITDKALDRYAKKAVENERNELEINESEYNERIERKKIEIREKFKIGILIKGIDD